MNLKRAIDKMVYSYKNIGFIATNRKIIDKLFNKKEEADKINFDRYVGWQLKNNLTNECSKDFCEMVLLNRHLEEINLGGNNLSDAFITNLKNFIGEYEMTPEEIEEHEIKVKEKEEILLFNQKNKNNKKVELKEIPFVDEVIKQEDKFIKIRNNTLRKIDFMLNNLTQKSFDDISYILEHILLCDNITILDKEVVPDVNSIIDILLLSILASK